MMKASTQLLLQSSVIASLVVMVVLGGSISTTTVRPSFASINNPANVPDQYDPDRPDALPALAQYYNLTLSYIGAERFENASFLLNTFHLVNTPLSVNQTAILANADLAEVNASIPTAIMDFDKAEVLIASREFLNASLLVSSGCQTTRVANETFWDFAGPRTAALQSHSVPVGEYAIGASLTRAEIQSLFARCQLLSFRPNGVLSMSSPQGSIRTGGRVNLGGVLSLNGAGLGSQRIHFYINGSYFGTLQTGTSGRYGGMLNIPFLYGPVGVVQAFVTPNATVNLGGARSNTLSFSLVYNQTSISIGDPPTYLPGETFTVSGTLKTTAGIVLPFAIVNVTSFEHSQLTSTNTSGGFSAQLTVPTNATDGVYDITAAFAPLGVLGPSRNFTTIEVAHLPVNLTLSAPFSLAGFPTELSGSAFSNGSGVQGVKIEVETPWGSFDTSSDPSGTFTVLVTTSPLDFALSERVSAKVAAEQPYVSARGAFASMSLFNMLLLPLLIVAAGVVSFEAYNVGVFEGLRTRGREQELSVAEQPETETGPIVSSSIDVPELVLLYRRAVFLASARFGLRFWSSQTIGEGLAMARNAGVGQGFEEFSRILSAAEDFLYASSFDTARTEGIRSDLIRLEALWK